MRRCAVILCAVFVPALAFGAAGRTAGQFNVSSVGSAQYTIPIWTPPGVRGVQPSLALTYSSNSGNGLLGIGWSLSGLGAIFRCNRTFAQDGVGGSPQLDSGDRFCMNGARLRTISGTYGADGTTYQTEVADFSVVTSKGTAGSGPAWFEVKDDSGLTYEYGHTPDSAIIADGSTSVRVWALNAVVDSNGNKMTFVYTNDTTNGSYRPQSIKYTFTSASPSAANYQVDFTYQSRASSDVLWSYTIGGKNNELNYLSQISVNAWNGSAWSLKRQYALTYQSSPTTSRMRMTSIQECAGAADCLPATTIGYQDGATGWGSESAVSGNVTNMADAMPIDLDGNGIDDLIYPDPGGNWYYLLGSSSGSYAGPYNTGIANTNYAAALPIDFNSDGKMDVLVPNASGNWRALYFQSGGGSFTYTDTATPALSTAQGLAAAADVDGDGRQDLVYAYEAETGWGAARMLYYRLNAGSSFAAQSTLVTIQAGGTIGPFSKWGTAAPFGSSATRFNSAGRRLDFNNDGRNDFLFYLANCSADAPAQCNSGTTSYTWKIILSQSNGSYLALDAIGFAYGSSLSVPPLTGDWNGDGCTDIAYPTSGTWRLRFGTCYRAGAGFSLSAIVNTGSVYYGFYGYAMDWDGDGRDDIISPNSGSPQYWGYARSTGATLNAWTSLAIPYTATTTMVTDANGDGSRDLLYAVSSALKLSLHLGVTPDLATSFKDGFEVEVNPGYVHLAQSNYTNNHDASYPYQDYAGPMNVVSGFSATNGIGGTYSQSFQYYGGWINLQGRGFSAFYAKRVQDSRNSQYEYTYYHRDFPRAGVVFQRDLKQSDDSTKISRTVNVISTTTLESQTFNQRYFPHIDSSTVSSYELDALIPGNNGRLITTAVTSYTFDSYGNVTTVATTVTDNDAYSPHAYDQWSSTTTRTIAPQSGCLRLPTQVSVTNTAPDGLPALTRTTNYTPNYTYCRQTQEVIEPASGSYRVTTDFGYDAFGNNNLRTVTGIGMVARTTSADWGTRGQFPVSVTNAENHTSLLSYDYELGVQTSQTDPNLLQVNFTYDGFGRRTSEARPDGTSTTWVYEDCTVSGCFSGNNRMTVTQTSLNSNATVFTRQLTHLDQFDRPIATRQRMFDGTDNRVETRYDALGRMSQQSAPCAHASCTAYWNTFTYDALNRVTLHQRPISASVPTLQSTSFAYSGRTTTVTDAEGKSSYRVTTVAGSLAKTTDHNSYSQSFTYDAFGSLLTTADSLSNTLFSATYDYGAAAYQRTLSDMDLGTRAYTYNALGELTNGSDGKGQSFSATYDKLSRSLTRVEPEGTTTWTWGNTAGSYNIGQLLSVSAPGYSETYSYDNKARLSNREIVSDTTYDYDYGYSSVTGMLSTLTYPTSTAGYRLALEYVYSNGMLQQVKDYNAGTVFWTANEANTRGQIRKETLGNGVVTQRTFDDVTGLLNRIESGVGSGSALQNESYLFDRVGNVIQRQNGNLGLSEDFHYDNLHRLAYSQLGGVTNLQLTYDSMGNITSRSDVAGGAAWTYHSTRKHAVTQAGSSSFTYSYDANGNAMTRNGFQIDWTSYNYPSVIRGPGKTMTFSYGPDRQRYKQTYTNGSTTETTTYVGGMVEKVVAGGVTDWRHYIRANGSVVAVMSRLSVGTNTTRYILGDHQGSISQITDSSGAAFVSESFTAFGARRDASTWSGGCNCPDLAKMKSVTRIGYTGHEAIGGLSMGLNHMNGRVQDAITGRFLSPDPHLTQPENTQNYNRYSYVNNNPMSYTDPSGFDPNRFIDTPPTPGNSVTVEAGRWVDRGVRDLMQRERNRQGTSGDGALANRGDGGDSEIIEEVITTAPKVPPPPAPPPPMLVPFAPAVQFISLLTDIVCKAPALTGTGQVQWDVALGPIAAEIQWALTLTSHGQIISQGQMGTLYGLGAMYAASASVQWGVMWRDATPGTSSTASYALNAMAIGGGGGGASIQVSADGISGGFDTSRARAGVGAAVGVGVAIGAGKLQGSQWASKGFCER